MGTADCWNSSHSEQLQPLGIAGRYPVNGTRARAGRVSGRHGLAGDGRYHRPHEPACDSGGRRRRHGTDGTELLYAVCLLPSLEKAVL